MKNLLASEKAVSAVVGMLIILALTITSISVILLYATPTINDMQDMANAQRVEQAFTVFDSRTSKVALGESPSQTTSFSIMDGSIDVNGDIDAHNESKIVIVCIEMGNVYNNYQTNKYKWGAWEPYLGKPELTVINASMGSITYTKEDRVIGYEGGGVWSKFPTGKAVMISPPEFHYNGETLTLPIMTITGTEVSSGTADVDVTVSSDNMPFVMYPDPSTDPRKVNPLSTDKVFIYIKSDFYNAWADYANSLAYTSAETDDANKTAIVELQVIPAMGKDKLTQTIKVGALDTSLNAPMYDFKLDLEARASQGLNPNNYQLIATSGTKTLIYSISKSGGPNQLEISVIYEESAAGGGIETWEGNTTFPVSGEQEDQSATVDFLSTTLDMIYDNKDGEEFSWDNETAISIGPAEIDYSNGDSVPLNNLTQHYMKLITRDGSIVFNLYQPGGSDPVDYDESTVTLFYEGMPGSITYLHVSRNDLSASLS